MLFHGDVKTEHHLVAGYSSKVYVSVAIAAAALLMAALGYIPLVNGVLLLPFILLVLSLHRVDKENKLVLTAFLIPTILLGFSIAIYRPAGFEYPLVWHTEGMYEGGTAFSLTANLGKVVGGYILIVWFARRMARIGPASDLIDVKQRAIIVALCILSVLLFANVFFDVNWQPKLSEGIIYFFLINLFFTVVSEEAFFRLLIHDHVAVYFTNRTVGDAAGIAVTTLLFALSHSSAYEPGFLLYAFAGFAYAFAYSKTKSLLACISVHFGVNILHFIFLEYPL